MGVRSSTEDIFNSFVDTVIQQSQQGNQKVVLTPEKFNELLNHNSQLNSDFNTLKERGVELKSESAPKGSPQYVVLSKLYEEQISNSSRVLSAAIQNKSEENQRNEFDQLIKNGNNFILNEVFERFSKNELNILFNNSYFIGYFPQLCEKFNNNLKAFEIFISKIPKDVQFYQRPELYLEMFIQVVSTNNIPMVDMCVKFFKEHNIDSSTLPGQATDYGLTPLDCAINQGTSDCANYLLDLLGDEKDQLNYLLNNQPKDIFYYSTQSSNTKITNLLLSYDNNEYMDILKKAILISERDELKTRKLEPIIDSLSLENLRKLLEIPVNNDHFVSIPKTTSNSLLKKILDKIPPNERLQYIKNNNDSLLVDAVKKQDLERVKIILNALEPNDQHEIVKYASGGRLPIAAVENTNENDELFELLWDRYNIEDKIEYIKNHTFIYTSQIPTRVALILKTFSEIPLNDALELANSINLYSKFIYIELDVLKYLDLALPKEIFVKLIDNKIIDVTLTQYLLENIDKFHFVDELIEKLEIKNDIEIKNAIAKINFDAFEFLSTDFKNDILETLSNEKYLTDNLTILTSQFESLEYIYNNKGAKFLFDNLTADVFLKNAKVMIQWISSQEGQKFNELSELFNRKLGEYSDDNISLLPLVSLDFSNYLKKIFGNTDKEFSTLLQDNHFLSHPHLERVVAETCAIHLPDLSLANWINTNLSDDKNAKDFINIVLKYFPMLFIQCLESGDITKIASLLEPSSVRTAFTYGFFLLFNGVDNEISNLGELINKFSPELKKEIYSSLAYRKFLHEQLKNLTSKNRFSDIFTILNMERTPFTEAIAIRVRDSDPISNLPEADDLTKEWLADRKEKELKSDVKEALEYLPFFNNLIRVIDIDKLDLFLDNRDLPRLLLERQDEKTSPNISKVDKVKLSNLIEQIPEELTSSFFNHKHFISYLSGELKKYEKTKKIETLNLDVMRDLNLNIEITPSLEVAIAAACIESNTTRHVVEGWAKEILEKENFEDYIVNIVQHPDLLEYFFIVDSERMFEKVGSLDLPLDVRKRILPLNTPSQIKSIADNMTENELNTILAREISIANEGVEGLLNSGPVLEVLASYNTVLTTLGGSPDNQALLLKPLIKELRYNELAAALKHVELHSIVLNLIPFLTGPQLATIVPLLTNEELLAAMRDLDDSRKKEYITYSSKSQRTYLLTYNVHYPKELLAWERDKETIALGILLDPLDDNDTTSFEAKKSALALKLTNLNLVNPMFRMARKGINDALTSKGEQPDNLSDEWKRVDQAIEGARSKIKMFYDNVDELLKDTEEVPEEFVDFVTKEPFEDPVRLSDGNVLERSTLEALNFINPFTRKANESRNLPTDQTVLDRMKIWNERKNYRDRFTKKLMEDPVRLSSGHIIDRSTLEESKYVNPFTSTKEQENLPTVEALLPQIKILKDIEEKEKNKT